VSAACAAARWVLAVLGGLGLGAVAVALLCLARRPARPGPGTGRHRSTPYCIGAPEPVPGHWTPVRYRPCAGLCHPAGRPAAAAMTPHELCGPDATCVICGHTHTLPVLEGALLDD
jgi:hypothetical protein